MIDIMNKFLLAGDKFMQEMHLRQDLHIGFTYRTCGRFTKNKERLKIFKETGDSRYMIWHDMAYGDFQDLPRRTAADKVLHDKGCNIAKNPKYYGYQCGLASVVYKFFDKKTSGRAIKMKLCQIKN